MKIRNNYIISDNIEFIGAFGNILKKDIVKNISDIYEVNLEVAEKVYMLADRIGTVRYSLDNFPEDKEYDINEIKINENKIAKLLNKEKIISINEFSLMYVDVLEKQRGEDIYFDKFLDFLQNNKDYGVISSMCEFSDPGEFGRLRYKFENEEIKISDIRNLIKV